MLFQINQFSYVFDVQTCVAMDKYLIIRKYKSKKHVEKKN